jgi:SAM-dependent methyltransferase
MSAEPESSPPQASSNYKDFWNAKAQTITGAMIAVDGSADEDVLRLTGAYSSRQVALALQLQPTDRVFELGCGVGRIGREIAPKVVSWHGLDISENMVGVARERLAAYPNVSASTLSRSQLDPLADASMDKGYCVAVFIHMDKEDFVLYLQEVARVLVPGGLFYFDTWNLAHPVGWRRYHYEVMQAGRTDPRERKDVARNQFCVPEEVALYAQKAGLEIVLMLTDSPWVQMVVRKPGEGLAADLSAHAAEIAYTPLWTELFDNTLVVLLEGRHPLAMIADLDRDTRGPETAMFRAWLGALWRENRQAWAGAPLPPGVTE